MPTRIVAVTVIIIGYNLSMDYVTYLKYHLCRRRAATGPSLSAIIVIDVVFVFLFTARKQ